MALQDLGQVWSLSNLVKTLNAKIGLWSTI